MTLKQMFFSNLILFLQFIILVIQIYSLLDHRKKRKQSVPQWVIDTMKDDPNPLQKTLDEQLTIQVKPEMERHQKRIALCKMHGISSWRAGEVLLKYDYDMEKASEDLNREKKWKSNHYR